MNNSETPIIDDPVFLSLVDSIKLPLDSITSPIITASCYKDGMYSFMKSNHKEIVFYDYYLQKEINRVIVQYPISSYQIIDSNHIVCYNYSKNILFKVNLNGNTLSSYKIMPTIDLFPSPIAKTSPIIVSGDTIIFTGHIGGESHHEKKNNRPTTGIYDTKKKSIEYSVQYPDIYNKYHFGGSLMRWIYSDYNDSKRTILYSFPASHYIYESCIDDISKLNQFYAGSIHITQIKPMARSKMRAFGSNARNKYFATTPSYSNILYDKYNDVYYRIAEQPSSDFDAGSGWHKEISVIILNNNFDIIGETYIGVVNPINRYCCFVNEKGLHIMEPSNKDENSIAFNIYSIKNKIDE
ncbi:MAG: DUF4221 family protein [Bacteroidales bacterium]|nr:DUF4221 family protein [Bacteroidales bacterium]MDD4669553.1 DUF4221 family protein [Bacteroidales bacterium]